MSDYEVDETVKLIIDQLNYRIRTIQRQFSAKVLRAFRDAAQGHEGPAVFTQPLMNEHLDVVAATLDFAANLTLLSVNEIVLLATEKVKEKGVEKDGDKNMSSVQAGESASSADR